MQVDVQKFIGELHAYIARAFQPIVDRLKALEERRAERGEKGDPGVRGDPGRDAPPVSDGQITTAVERHLQAHPPARGEKGEPGAAAPPVTNERLLEVVAGHMSRNPPPRGEKGDPGRDAPPITDAQLSTSVAAHLRAYPPAPGAKGDPGTPGRDADPVTDAQVATAVGQFLRANPPAPGAKGEPGRDAEPVADARLAEVVAAHLKANPPAPGAKGEPGEDAEPISLAEVLRELLASEELRSLVELLIKEEVAEIPKPKDGNDAEPVSEAQISTAVERHLKSHPPTPGAKGEPGTAGADGVGLAGFLIDRDGVLVATTSKGEAIRLGEVVGKNGRDGLGFEDVEFEYDGERTVTAKFVRGGSVLKTVPWRFPVIIDRGYWKQGFKAQKGDAVTSEGTLYIALRDTAVKPSTGATDDWRVGARRGRDASSSVSTHGA